MNTKRILGVIIVIIGIAMLFSSIYIKNKVLAGRQQISEAQSNVKQGSNILSLNPVSKEVGNVLMQGAQSQIDEGKRKADYYAQVAMWLKMSGIILIILGLLVVIFGKKKKVHS